MATRIARKYPSHSIERIAKIATAATVALSVGSFAIEFLPNSFYLHKYRKVFALYSLGEEAALPQDVVQLFNTVLDDLKIREKDKPLYKPFSVTGFNMYNAGIADPKFGAIIGIPKFFTYKDKFAIDYSEIRVGRDAESLNPYHPEADNLLDSFLMSEKAKKFGIAREILMAQKQIPMYRSIVSAAMVCITALGTEGARVQWGLSHRPKIISGFVYVASGVLGLITWAQIRDLIYTRFEKIVDEELAKLGPDYVEGGIEFYEKQIQKNIALRSLMGPGGIKTFNRHGDEIFLLRQRRTPVTQRKRFFQEYTTHQQENSITQ